MHAAYEVLRDPAKRQQYDARRHEDDGREDEDGHEFSNHSDSDSEYESYYREAHARSWAEFIRRMQASASREPAQGWGYDPHEADRVYREFETRRERERADWKELEQKRWKAAQKIRQAQAEHGKTLRMEREEAARENAIAHEDRLHENHTKPNKKTKQAASRKNCTCQGCRDRFIREQSEKDQHKKDPKGYAERMKIREAVAACKEKEAARRAQQDAEREAQDQRAAAKAAAKKEIAQEKAARERLHHQLAEQEARQKAEAQAAVKEIANRRRLEQLARRDVSKQAAIDMDTRQAHQGKTAIATPKEEEKAVRHREKQIAKEQEKQDANDQAKAVHQEVQGAPASEPVTERVEREVIQQTPVDTYADQHGPRAQPLPAGGDRRAKMSCKYGDRCKFNATGKCMYLHSYKPVVNGTFVSSGHIPTQPAEPQSPVVADVKPVENIAKPPQAKGSPRSKFRCKLKNNCKYLEKGTCVYRHTEAELAHASMGAGVAQPQPSRTHAPQDPTIPESTPQPDPAGFKARMQKLDKRFPEFTDWQVLPGNPSDTVDRATSKPATHTPPQLVEQAEQTQLETAVPGLLVNLSPGACLKISTNYIQTTKDGVILKLLEEGKHVPADGITVDLGWVNTGFATMCSFCKFKKLKYSFRCPQGNAVACRRCKKSLSTVTPQDEAVLLSTE